MKIAAGTVTNGRIVVEGQPFSEGESVTILSDLNEPPHTVGPDERRLLLESIAQADRGEFVDVDQLLAELDEPS